MYRSESHPIFSKAARVAFGMIALAFAPAMARADDTSIGKQAPQPAQTTVIPAAVAMEEINPGQPLRPGTVIHVGVQREPEPSGIYTVNQAGDILLRIAEMTAAVTVIGQTPEQATETITAFLKTYLRKPQVAVSIVAVPQPTVTLTGAVRASGPVTISRLTTLADILSRAGWTENANLSQVRVTHRDAATGSESRQALTWHLDAYLCPTAGTAPDEMQNPILQDRDVIFVPYKILGADGVVTVAGAVTKPQVGLPLRANPPLTLREAISLSGGVTPEADRHKVIVHRAGSNDPLIVDLDRAEQDEPTANIALRSNDSIYVEKLETSAFYTVNGGVVKAGKFFLDRPVTLTQAIMTAGGMSPFARDKKGYILRCPDGVAAHARVVTFNWPQILAGKAADVPVQPGDNIWVIQGGPSHSPDALSLLGVLGSLRLLF
jgi:protein involved in polysaccharide export with SLBB domain